MERSMHVRIVPMTGDHLDEVAELERICFSTPWSRNMLAEELENDCSALLAALDDSGRVVGYAGLQVILDEGYITNVAVRPECRRRGVAQKLLQVFLDFAQAHRLAFLTLEVRASNYGAIALYGSRGFRSVGRRKNYYEHPREDAVIMTKEFSHMELKIPTLRQLRTVYDAHLRPSFPPAELKPLRAIESMWEDGCYRPWCLFDGSEIVGECFLWLGRPGWGLLDYLCVSPRRRNAGTGALLLEAMRRCNGDLTILAESELPRTAPDPAMAERRLGFYARNGARLAGYDTAMFGVPYKTLYWSEGPVGDDVLMDQHRFIYQNRFSPEKYAKFIRIPLDPAEPLPRVPWDE